MKPTENSLIPYYEKIDLSQKETLRVYVFPGGDEVRIEDPTFLIISDNGHRIGQSATSHYVPYGWIHLWWINKGDQNFICEGDPNG